MWFLGFALLACAWAQLDPTCVDKLPNCADFPESSCKGQYEQWAKVNCNNTCKYCIGPTKAPPPCEDTIKDCDLYDQKTCSDPKFGQWAEKKCRYFCRKCSPGELAIKDAQRTTVPASACVDKLDCRLYGKSSCTGNFVGWAKQNCMAFCNFCTPLATPPHACVDKIPNCSSYDKDTCTNKDYALWAQDHCAKYCGVCPGGGPVATPPPLVHHVTSGPGPMTPPSMIHLTPPPPGK